MANCDVEPFCFDGVHLVRVFTCRHDSQRSVIEDAYGGSSPHPLATCRSCVIIGKIAAMISAVNSTCGAEAEPAAEEDAEAKAEAGEVHGRNNWRQLSDRGSEASAG